jgi:hypothetical protein
MLFLAVLLVHLLLLNFADGLLHHRLRLMIIGRLQSLPLLASARQIAFAHAISP